MKEYFYTVTESMLDLGLRGTELNLFAVIYGYSQRGDGICCVSRKELARRCGVNTEKTIYSALKGLVEKGLIKKQSVIRDGAKIDGFSYAYDGAKITDASVKITDQSVKITDKRGAKITDASVKITDQSVKITADNKDIIIKDNIINPPYNPPTRNEIEEYARQRGFADPAGFADYFWTICENNGWKMAGGKGKGIENWKNYIVSSWESRHKSQVFAKSATGAREMSPEEFRKRFIK